MQRFATIVLCTLALAAFLAVGAMANTPPAAQKSGCCAAHTAAAKEADSSAKAKTVGCDHAKEGHHVCDPATCDPAKCSHAHGDQAKCGHATAEVKEAKRGCNPAQCRHAVVEQVSKSGDQAKTKKGN